MSYILRIGYRHLEAIRCQTLTVAMGFNWSKRQFDFRTWLQEQAPELLDSFDSLNGLDDIPSHFKHERTWHYALLLNCVLTAYESASTDPEIQYRFAHSMVSTSRSVHADEDYAGADQGGSWNAEPFAFRAGIIMTLGALEEFERGALRILTGLKHIGKCHIGDPQPFRPRLADFKAVNPAWDALERNRKTYYARGRAEIFESFGIKRPRNQWRKRLDKCWKERNELAHGISPVKVTLGRFLQTHYDCFTAMHWLSDACCTAQNVLL